MEKVVISCSESSAELLVYELSLYFPRIDHLDWLAPGVALAEVDMGFSSFASECLRQKPIFLRHLCPVQREVALTGAETDLPLIQSAITELLPRLQAGKTFSVQARIAGGHTAGYTTFLLQSQLSTLIQEQSGLELDTRKPEQVVSIWCGAEIGFLGISRTDQNRSSWTGGEQRFKKEPAQVSRSEFKLLEAIDLYHLKVPETGLALDMGAAPGGWTRILQARGLRVIALDPADLDIRVKALPGVEHIRKRTQEYLRTGRRFDLLVNDMRMDSLESAGIMAGAAQNLRPGGLGIMTIKLPEHQVMPEEIFDRIRQAREILETAYKILGIRQLFHNRSEVTAMLQKLPEQARFEEDTSEDM